MPTPAALLSGTTWTLSSLRLGGASITPGRPLSRPTLRISGSSVIGRTGCSPLRARVILRGQAIRFRNIDPGPSDRCPDHALSLREDFVSLLSGVTRYDLRGQTLTLYSGSAAGTEALIFTASEARP